MSRLLVALGLAIVAGIAGAQAGLAAASPRYG
jgi:hypothetical protein